MQIFRKVTESTSFIRSMSVATFTLLYVNRKYTLRVGFIAYCRTNQTNVKNLLYSIAVYYENISVEANMVATIRKQYN